MRRALVFATVFGRAACGGDKPKLAPAGDSTLPKAVAAPAAEPAKSEPDKELARRVAGAMEGAKLHGIDVVAADGVVTLWGSTPSVKERDRAGQVAAKVQGVKAVENKLDVVTGS
ncbi:MAG TPA: BON domain-containing protein [Burkholderiales bacterium]|nr:BON domain-containing protein [Burkholderiales bacterium]